MNEKYQFINERKFRTKLVINIRQIHITTEIAERKRKKERKKERKKDCQTEKCVKRNDI